MTATARLHWWDVTTTTWVPYLPLPLPLLPQDLLYRRMRSLANAESANKKLETAKAKNKGVQEVRFYDDANVEISGSSWPPLMCHVVIVV